MLSIKFYNETGSITFGGGKSDSAWKLTEAEGLAGVDKSFTAVRYANTDGQETTEVRKNARCVTLSGDIAVGDDFAKEYSRALAVLEEEGWLEISASHYTRRIRARCSEYRQGERKGRFLMFTVQFICDNPFFEDIESVENMIFAVIPKLDENFEFPGAFSGRISESAVNYDGNARTEPMFFIEINDAAEGDNVISLYNSTSGESLKLNYDAAAGECVIVDVQNRKVYNSDGENLLKHIADDSFFDGFHLYPGINEIVVINNNMNTGITVMCRYTRKFAEAVLI